MNRKILSIFVAAMMLLSIVPMKALAANNNTVAIDEIHQKGEEEPQVGSILFDFEESCDWLFVDSDGDDYNWDWSLNGNWDGHNGSKGLLTSASYINDVGALTPDNWAITPGVEVPDLAELTFSFFACAQDMSWAAENFAVYVSNEPDIAGMINIGTFTMTSSITRTQGSWYQYKFDSFDQIEGLEEGTVYFAIRHFDCTDWFWLNVDDVEIGGVLGGTAIEPTDPEPIDPPEPNDAYPVDIIGICTYDFAEVYTDAWIGFNTTTPAMIQRLADAPDSYAATLYDYTVYGITTDGVFYTIGDNPEDVTYGDKVTDATATSMTFVGETLYTVIVEEDGSVLCTVDTDTGEITKIGILTNHLFGIAGTPEGLIYGIDANGDLYTVNETNAELTFVGSTGIGCAYVQDIVYDPENEVLFWAQVLDFNEHGLYMIDPATLEVTYCGEIGTSGMEIVGMFIVPEYEEPEYVLGDVNLNGEVETVDAILALGYCVGVEELDDIQLFCADVDINEEVDVIDTLLILRYALGLIDYFPGEILR